MRRKKLTVPIRGPDHWRYDLIAIGASAGGLGAITEVLTHVPRLFPAIVVVQHLDPTHESHLARLLASKSSKTVKQAEHSEVIVPGVVYIAPPDEHLLVGPGKIQLAHTQLVHFSRPSIDLLFESVAGIYGSRSIAVILSGSNKDGSFGIRAVRQAGGITVAQDPNTAEYAIMPKSAVLTGCVDYVVNVNEIGALLTKLWNGEQVRQ